jgi:xylan 1,4-beta-xylosidase
MADTINIKVDASKTLGELKHTWRYIGYDECNYTHTPEGYDLIAQFGELMDAPYYIRAHHMLCTGNCHGFYKWGSTNAYVEDEHGLPIYNWDIIDKILDVYMENNCKPFFELGFMPMDLADPKFSSDGKGFRSYREYQTIGWACPPKDYNKWYNLIYNLVAHCVERYGREEVINWYWEMWNEPDGIYYWKGTVDEFCKLYDYTEAAVHAVLPNAKFGGPATCGPLPNNMAYKFLERFLAHCIQENNYISGDKGTRIDFITFHVKGGGFEFKINAPKETPTIKRLIDQVKCGLEIIRKYNYNNLEVILSEADPDGWAAGGMYDNTNLNFRNTEYYASYVAASYHSIEKMAKRFNMEVYPLAWAFMFRGERCFEGTRTFSTQGINKAIFNLFRMFAQTGYISLEFSSSKEDVLKDAINKTEISGMATKNDDGFIQIMIYSHNDDWDINDDYTIELEVDNVPFHKVSLRHYRIDSNHSNAYAEWIRQGRPDYPDEEQYKEIKNRDCLQLIEPEKEIDVTDGKIKGVFTMPTHSVSQIIISPQS